MAIISYACVSFVSPLINKSQFCGSFPVRIGSARNTRGVKLCRASAAAVVFPSLDADDFRHPLDKQAGPLIFPYHIFCVCHVTQYIFLILLLVFVVVQNTVLLRAIPGLNDIGKAFLGNI